MVQFTGRSYTPPPGATRQARDYISYYFETDARRGLIVAHVRGAWRCVGWRNGQPITPQSEQEAADMRDAEAQAAALWEAEAPRQHPVA